MGASEWIGLAGVLLATVSLLVGFLGGRRTERNQRDRAEQEHEFDERQRLAAERAQRELALQQRRADLYPALNKWASDVYAKSHIDPEDRRRRAVIPSDVIADAHAYASDAVLDQVGVMTELRDRDPEKFLRPGEQQVGAWEAHASFRRSERLRREARVLRAIIRNELNSDSPSRERDTPS
jgi:hypothetical protein